ncbi:hypothetical protein [Methylorubrum suomiense]|uniref:hypothetical protein n=1 Tax=Methylorubrum suomiense TaxID=144191 RepID=UPI0027E495CC|nr:hypothetical protein [Methylorubrum suomiense]
MFLARAIGTIAKPDAGAAAVLRNELKPGRLKRFAQGPAIVFVGLTRTALKIRDCPL